MKIKVIGVSDNFSIFRYLNNRVKQCMIALSGLNKIKLNILSLPQQISFKQIMKQVNKQQAYIRLKSVKPKKGHQPKIINKSTQLSSLPSQSLNIKIKVKQNDSILNVSLIEASSFTSNRHDGSLDSMDKMIIGVSGIGIDQKQFQEDQVDNGISKQSINDFDFNEIHKQYEKLIGRNQLLGEQQEEDISQSVEENSRVLPDEDEWQFKQGQFEKRLSLSLSPKKSIQTQNDIKQHLLRIQNKIDELKHKKNLDNSNNSIKIFVTNLGNLSEIHQQRQNLLNTSTDVEHKRNEEEEQQFIDFVTQPDPHENNENNQKKHEFDEEHEGNQWLGTPVLQNLQLELEKDKQHKKYEKSANCQQILEALNSKEEQQTPSKFVQILRQRQQWIKNNNFKSNNWKNKQIFLLQKMKKVIKNPQYDSSESED